MFSLSSHSSTLRSPSSPIQEEDEEKLSEMSDAQPHTMLSSSPAPTDVRHILTSWHLHFDSAANKSVKKHFFVPSSSRAQQPRMWQNPCLQMMVSFLSWRVFLSLCDTGKFAVSESWIHWYLLSRVIQRTGCMLEETSYRTAAVNTAAWPKQRATHRATCLCQVRNPLPGTKEIWGKSSNSFRWERKRNRQNMCIVLLCI